MTQCDKDRPRKPVATDPKPTLTIAMNDLQIIVRLNGFDGYKIALLIHSMTVQSLAPQPHHLVLDA